MGVRAKGQGPDSERMEGGREGWGRMGSGADVQAEEDEKDRTGSAGGLFLAKGQLHGLRLDREKVALV